MCKLYIQPWREGLHNICARCERDTLTQALAAGPTWLVTEIQLERIWELTKEHNAIRQASEAVRIGLQNPIPYPDEYEDE